MTPFAPILPARCPDRNTGRPGFTLVEMVLSLSITAILMAGIAFALSLAGRTVGSEADPDTPALAAVPVLRDLTADLNMALLFTERGDHAVEFTVPDRDGDDEPELIRYVWSGTPGDPLERWINGSGPVVVATNVHVLDFSYLLETRGAAALPPEIESPEVEHLAHDDDPGGQLVPDRYTAEVALLESWGYTLAYIDVTATAGEFDTALAGASLALIPPGTSDAALGTKLRETSVGVVTESADLADEMGLSWTAGSVIAAEDKIRILRDDAPHEITDPFSDGDMKVVDEKQPFVAWPGGLGSATFHARHRPDPKDPALAVIETGAALEGPGGGSAPARRVFMPWGGKNFDHGILNADGQMLLRQSLEWAANGALAKNLLMVVEGLGTGLNDMALTQDAGPALCFAPTSLPVNTISWSITRFLAVASQHGPALDGAIDLALTVPAPGPAPSTLALWSVTQLDESELPATPSWFEFAVDVANLDPDDSVCLEIIGHKSSNEKRDASIGFETNDAFVEAGPLWMTTTDHGDTWSSPDPTRRLRLYVYGTYTTLGAPEW